MYPKLKSKNLFLAATLLLGGFTACTETDFDILDGVDLTIGVGGGELNVPSSSTSMIKLSDILELKDGDCVRMEENGDYVFEQEPGDVAAAHPRINEVTIQLANNTGLSIPLTVPTQSSAARRAKAAIQAEGAIRTFQFSTKLPDNIESLKKASVSNEMNFSVIFPKALKDVVSEIDEITLTLPDYLTIEGRESNHYVFKNVKTSEPFALKVKIVGIDFTKKGTDDEYLRINNRNIEMSGFVSMSLIATNYSTDPQKLLALANDNKLSSSLEIGNFTITGATGFFNPTIDLGDLGNVTINSVPDFLKEEGVVIDLDNPQITLSIDNDMAVEGLINGTITAYKNGKETARVTVPEITVKADAKTTVCICRKPVDGVDCIIVPNLSTLIETIPDNITFSADVKANPNKEATVLLGHSYNIKPSYSIKAPVALAEKANIIYVDEETGWNEDIEDIDLSRNASIHITADVENTLPAYCQISLTPIDKNGKEISANDLFVGVINEVAASTDGINPASSRLDIEIKQVADNALKKLDGVKFRINVKAKSADAGSTVTGITLNGEKQSLTLKNIEIKLKGQAIFDLN